MFAWLKRSGYTSRERNIFRFWDGSVQRGIDPLMVANKLLHDVDIEADMKLASVTCPETEAALGRIADRVRDVFGIPAFTERDGKSSGLTIDEALSLLVRFNNYLADLKKKLDPSLTLPPATDSPTV